MFWWACRVGPTNAVQWIHLDLLQDLSYFCNGMDFRCDAMDW